MLEENVENLKLNEEITNFLRKERIIKVKHLTNRTKTDLKNLGLQGYQISEIEVKLQLEGLDLKTNHKTTK